MERHRAWLRVDDETLSCGHRDAGREPVADWVNSPLTRPQFPLGCIGSLSYGRRCTGGYRRNARAPTDAGSTLGRVCGSPVLPLAQRRRRGSHSLGARAPRGRACAGGEPRRGDRTPRMPDSVAPCGACPFSGARPSSGSRRWLVTAAPAALDEWRIHNPDVSANRGRVRTLHTCNMKCAPCHPARHGKTDPSRPDLPEAARALPADCQLG